MNIKKIMLRMALCAEMCFFGYMYVYGKNGLHVLSKQKKDLRALELQVAQLTADVQSLEADIHVWQTNDFYKEKIAREQLQMARKGDKLFYIGT